MKTLENPSRRRNTHTYSCRESTDNLTRTSVRLESLFAKNFEQCRHRLHHDHGGHLPSLHGQHLPLVRISDFNLRELAFSMAEDEKRVCRWTCRARRSRRSWPCVSRELRDDLPTCHIGILAITITTAKQGDTKHMFSVFAKQALQSATTKRTKIPKKQYTWSWA